WVPFQLLYLGPFSNVRCKRTEFQPLPIAVQRSMDIRRSPLSFDGYTATTPAAVTLSDTP
ncbi:hypothetical protein, partial [Bacteroides acidifaciens]|uniref:hypothetical protein n=1 Tax=Bacteroides acidifaciens TaxID=85831 RepID=UPI0025845D8E